MTSGAPLVTIGISTFNRAAATFPEALASALAQTYEPLEVVVCDNASEDGTEAFMRGQLDPRLRYHRHPTNIGANANFNSCLELARGRYFVLLHDDDRLEPTFLTEAVTALGDADPGVLLAGAHMIDGQGRRTSTRPPPPPGRDGAGLLLAWFERTTSFYLCSTVFHSERLRQVGGFDSPHGLFQDVLAIARLAIRHGYVSVPAVGGSFRRHDANRGTASAALHWADDSRHLLDTVCDELPHVREQLYELGAPYLAGKCYRYVAAVRSPLERWRLYREIHRRFDRSYSPWRYLLTQRRRRVRRYLGGLKAAVGARRP